MGFAIFPNLVSLPWSRMLPRSLTSGEPGGVFYLHGDDEYRKAAAATALVDRHLDPGMRDFNLDVLRAGEATTEQLASVISTPPMMAEWRVVHVKDAEALASSPKARKFVLDTARNPPPGLVLILQATVPAKSKAKFYSDLSKLAKGVAFKQVALDEAPSWLVTWADDHLDVPLELDAARGLVAAVGTDLGLLTRELQKLQVMAGEEGVISRAVVERGGIRVPRQDRWEWFRLVGERKISQALEGLEILLEHGESPVGLVVGLGSHLLRVGVAVEGGQRALEGVLPPYQRFLAGKLMGQSKAWDQHSIAQAIKGLRRLDQLLKSSSVEGSVLLEEWLLGIGVRGAQPR